MIKSTWIAGAALTASLLAPMASAAAGDYSCEAQLFDRTARLTLRADQPVQYQWHDQPAYRASMRGAVITIDASPKATLSNVVIGVTAAGQKAIQGDWKFMSNTQANVFFLCTPQ